MPNKIKLLDKNDNDYYKCPTCGYIWYDPSNLIFNEEERVPSCPDCGELIEDGGDY